MKNFNILCLFIFLSLQLNAQFAPDFTIEDTNGNTHQLYADNLDQGKTVVVKLFFVGCPPCTNIAPAFQELYETWGEGAYDVEFYELTTQAGNTNAAVKVYLDNLGVTVPAAGFDGGGYSASEPYRQSDFGTFFGTPSFAVIAPDRNVVYFRSNSNLEAVHDAILSTGATGPGIEPEPEPEPVPASFTFSFNDNFGDDINGAQIQMRDLDTSNPTTYSIDSSLDTLKILSLEEEYPGITSPVFTFQIEGSPNEGVSGLDLITIQKHILSFELLETDEQLVAADGNADGNISALDLITLRKIILGFETEFPNGASSWIILNNDIPAVIQEGIHTDINVDIIKRGNVSN